MEVLNSCQDSKPSPELCKDHDTKTSPYLRNKEVENTEAESTQIPAGKSKDAENQESTPSMNSHPDSDQKGKVSTDKNMQTSQGKNVSSSSAAAPKEAETNDDGNKQIGDFTFACSQPDSPVTADMLFHNGQIRPLYHSDNTDNVDNKKMVVEERNGGLVQEPSGPYCAWSPEPKKKAGLTGISRRWSLKDFVIRSRSEGDKRKSGDSKGKRDKEGDKYLPQVGFITNVNGLSSNNTKVTKPI